ncbi:caspase family protein [Rhizobium leguminosarum]|uniref:caspase family protein n=1 Tax=Rhizobium leguminosarum TaxID=384 RepID=UPI00103F7E0A|nr:caspase family protein [Rhizobium leguminosarum]TBZ20407.1 caspase family protein [Rhizobium leguminosarum bv. viciae]
MDKLFEKIVEAVPLELLPFLLMICAFFFGVYYYYGYRDFTDVLRSRIFLTGAVVLVATFAVASILKTPAIAPAKASAQPVLLVPNFENDIRDQYHSVFLQQVRASFSRLGLDVEAVVPVDAYITDAKAAALHMQRYNAQAAIFAPKVVVNDGKSYLCVSLLVPSNGGSKAYPPTVAEIEPKVLEDMVAMIYPVASLTGGVANPMVTRLQALERQVADLQATVLALTTDRVASVPKSYSHRYAVVVGNNVNDEGSLPPLQFALSDARSVSDILKKQGFQVTLLENPTTSEVLLALDRIGTTITHDDLLAFYYAGSAIRASDLFKTKTEALVLATRDLVLSQSQSNLTLQALIGRMLRLSNRDNMIILDGCHGTAGLDPSQPPVPGGAEGVLQILSGSQDDGYGLEDYKVGGGVFTQALLKGLSAIRDADGRLSFRSLATEVTRRLAADTNTHQTPKLVSFGEGDIWL